MVRLNLPASRAITDDEIQIVAQGISGATERLAIWRSKDDRPPSPEQVASTLMELFWVGLGSIREGDSWAPGDTA